MEELLKKFRSQLRNVEKNLVALAHTWHELSLIQGARERVKTEFGITDATLDMLEKIDAKVLYPTTAWQTRGLLRVGKMPYDDQKKLIVEGVEILVKGVTEKLRLNQLSNEQVCQVVTTQGRIRPVNEQKELVSKPKVQRPPYEFNAKGIRFRRNVTLTVMMLRSIIEAYRKWRPSRGRRR